MKNSITTHDENLSTHEQRWDIYVTRKFFRNLINAYEISKEEYDQLSKTDPDGVATQSIEAINYELNNALEDAEIEKFSPKVGSFYATQVGISERTGKLETDDPEKVGKIAKVNKPGYKMKKIDPESKTTIIKESVVTVYISPHSGDSD